jgi:hypothetical protein
MVATALCATAMLGASMARADTARMSGARTSASQIEPSASGDAAAVASGRRWLLTLGLGYMLGLTQSEVGDSPGAIAVDEPSFFELAVAPLYRVGDGVVLGPRLGYGFELKGRQRSDGMELSRNLWQLALTGRYQPLGRGPYVGFGIGGAAVVDHAGDASLIHSGVSLEASAGVDLTLAESFGIGVELRAVHAELPEEASRISGDELSYFRYGGSSWLALSFVGKLAL